MLRDDMKMNDWLSTLTLKPMLHQHIESVSQVEQLAYPFPWTSGNFHDALNANYSGFLLQDMNQTLIGYAVLMQIMDDMHLLNFTIVPCYQGQGVGQHFLQHLCAWAIGHYSHSMLLEVRESNHRAIALYKKFGFQQLGIRKNYYQTDHGREHAFVMQKGL